MEPIAIRPHRALTHRPELEGKHAIININDDLGLSVIWAKGERFSDPWGGTGHGLYCDEGRYEVALIKFRNLHVSEGLTDPWNFTLLPEATEPIGWLTPEQIGRLTEDVKSGGIPAYNAFTR